MSQSRTKKLRPCPADGCTEQIPRYRAFCRTHWYWLPKPLRDAIVETWKKGATKSWLENLQEANRLIRERQNSFARRVVKDFTGGDNA